jgi:uncharacterized lipoprotein YddW (UPF0748 family)
VTLVNASDDPGQAVIADAVRFGGGLGSIPEPGGTSGRPRWEEAAKYWARYQGAPPGLLRGGCHQPAAVCRVGDGQGLPRRGAERRSMSRGTPTPAGAPAPTAFIHNTEPTPGSAELQRWIHTELIHDLRAAWNPQWVNRGRKSADFGELRELSAIPGVLLEIAFHDSEDPGDADDLREPVFRQIAARAVYQGIVKYYAAQEGTPRKLLPEPPGELVARNSGAGQVTLSWAPPACCDGVSGDAATAYKVYRSVGGRAFDSGVETQVPSLTVSGLPPGSLWFFRVTALNEGGESFPTPVVAVRTTASGQRPPLLIVDGFDRLDQEAMVGEQTAYFLGTVQRMYLERMNRYDYAVEHGQALAACGWAFDGALNEAVETGRIALGDYAALDWFVGEDSVADASLSATERALLRAYLAGGGNLLLSGAEIGYDLVEFGRDPAFFRDLLRADYLGDDAATYRFAGVAGGPFEGLAGAFDDGSHGAYDVGYPDRLAARAGASVALRYTGGTGDGAAVAYDGAYRSLTFGFPLEAVTDRETRTALFCAAAGYLLDGEGPAEERCTPRLINPGFEGGREQSVWQVATSDGGPVLASRQELPGAVQPHGGDWLAWLGSHTSGVRASSAITQAVALPPGEPAASLSLAWYAYPLAGGPNAGDILTIGLYDLNGRLLANLLAVQGGGAPSAWQTTSLDLSAFSGTTLQLVARAESSGTAFFLDDLLLTTCGPLAADEFRALWVDAYHDGFRNRKQIDELVETARAGNLNALVVQVRRRGDTYYPSAIDPWAPNADRSFDALAYLIERAHAAGLEVHAWATTLAIWNGEVPPAAPGHTFNLHGPGATGRNYWLMDSDDGRYLADDGVIYLDPGHPDAADYTVAVYAELAARYDLDGLHLDRVRYPGRTWGYNPTSVARFQAQAGRGDRPGPDDAQWLQWRRDQVTALVRKIYLAVAAINPRMRVSAALSVAGSAPSTSLPWETRTPYGHHLQDWRGWLQEGILDLGLTMTYRDEDLYATDFSNWVEWQKDHQYGRGLVVGTGLYLNTVEDSMAQWQRARQPSRLGNRPRGLAGYSYATPSDRGTPRRTFVNAAVSTVLTQPASPPMLPWKDVPSRGHLAGTVSQGSAPGVPGSAPGVPGSAPGVPGSACLHLDGYSLVLSGPESRLLRADGSGWFGAVDLLPGSYALLAEVPWLAEGVRVEVQVRAGAVAEIQVTLPACPVPSVAMFLPLVIK